MNGHPDIYDLAAVAEQVGEPGTRVANLGLRIVYEDFEISLGLIEEADALSIFVELACVIGAGEQIFQNERMRDSDRLGVLHRRAQFAAGNLLVAVEADLADFDLRTFFDNEVDADRSRRNPAHFGADGSELPPMLTEQALQHHLRLLHLRGIILTLLRKPDFLFLETIKHVALRNRIQAGVLNLADGRLLSYVDVNDYALRSFLPLEAKIVVVAGIPERIEVSLNSLRIVDIAWTGENPRLYRFCRNAAVSPYPNVFDERLLGMQMQA